jgi:hypothetical protein
MNTNTIFSGALAVLVASSALLTGCSSQLPAAQAPASAPVEEVAIAAPAGPPDQVEMSWQDSGVALRPLSAPGRERELAHPVTASVHRGGLSVAPPSNADGYAGSQKAKAAKKAR